LPDACVVFAHLADEAVDGDGGVLGEPASGEQVFLRDGLVRREYQSDV